MKCQHNGNIFSCGEEEENYPRISNRYFDVQEESIDDLDEYTTAASGLSYIYTFPCQSNCMGSTSELEVCYKASSNNGDGPVAFMSLFLFNQKNQTAGTVNFSTPEQPHCYRLNTTKICCGETQFDEIEITQKHAGFGVTIISENALPYRFPRTNTEFATDNYEWNFTNSTSYSLANGSNALLLLRLHISKLF